MFEVGQRVVVGNAVGVVEKVSTWKEVNGPPSEDLPCYFVRVKGWDNGTNGGRWLGESGIKQAPDTQLNPA